MAATLQAQIGDTVKLIPQPGSKPQPYKVTGVGLITAPDQVFQPLNPSVGPAPAQPPENAVIMQFGTFKRTLGRHLPPVTTASALANSQPGAQKGVQWQVQAQLDPRPARGRQPVRGVHARRPDAASASSARSRAACSSSTTSPTR